MVLGAHPTVVLTHAESGIGLALARFWAASGAKLALVAAPLSGGADTSDLKPLRHDLLARGARTVHIERAFLQSQKGAERLMRNIHLELGSVDIVVCSPPPTGELWDFDRDFWGSVHLSFAAETLMRELRESAQLIQIVALGGKGDWSFPRIFPDLSERAALAGFAREFCREQMDDERLHVTTVYLGRPWVSARVARRIVQRIRATHLRHPHERTLAFGLMGRLLQRFCETQYRERAGIYSWARRAVESGALDQQPPSRQSQQAA